MTAHTNVCVIGLGSMGMGAARACLQAGLNTWGVDINPDNCRALLAAGAKGAGPSAVPFAAFDTRRDTVACDGFLPRMMAPSLSEQFLRDINDPINALVLSSAMLGGYESEGGSHD